MNIKPSALVFVMAVGLSTCRHDIYHAAIATASIIGCFWLARCFKNRRVSIGILLIGSVTVTQLAVSFRRGFLETGWWNMAAKSKFMVFGADVLHGFREVAVMSYSMVVAVVKALGWADYSKFEGLNPRFFVATCLLLILSIYLSKRKIEEPMQVERE